MGYPIDLICDATRREGSNGNRSFQYIFPDTCIRFSLLLGPISFRDFLPNTSRFQFVCALGSYLPLSMYHLILSMSSPDGAPLMSERRTEQSLLNLHQSINELEQSMRKLYHTTSANGVAVENSSDEIRSLKREMLRNEQWNHLQHQRTNQQLQQQSMQFQQQSMQLQQQHNSSHISPETTASR